MSKWKYTIELLPGALFARYWVEIYNPNGKKVDGEMFFFKESGKRWAEGKIKSISQARTIKPEVFEVEV